MFVSQLKDTSKSQLLTRFFLILEYFLNMFVCQLKDTSKSQLLTRFFLILEDISPFVGPLISLFWTSGGISSWFQNQSG